MTEGQGGQTRSEQERQRLLDIVRRRRPREAVDLIIQVSRHQFRRALTTVVGMGVVGSLIVIAPGLYDRWQDARELDSLRQHYLQIADTIYFRDGNTEVAQSFVDKALELDPDDPEARYLSAFLDGMAVVYRLLNLDRPLSETERDMAHRALAGAEFLISVAPSDPRGRLLRGQAFMALERYVEAEQELRRAIAMAENGDRPGIAGLAHWRLGVTLLERASLNEKNLAETRARMDRLVFQRVLTEFDIAMARFADAGDGNAAGAEPARKWPQLWKGIAYTDERGNFARAIAHFEAALDIDPNFALAHFNLGHAYLNRALSADRSQVEPERIESWYETARRSFEQAIHLDPGLREGYFGLGLLFGARTEYGVSVRYFDKALEADDKYLRALDYRSQALTIMGRSDEALADLDRAIEISPGDATLYVRRARLEIRLGQLRRAGVDLQFARELGSYDRLMPLTQAELHLALGQPGKAVEAVEQALDRARKENTAADFAEAYEVRARARKALGQDDEAGKDFARAIDVATYRPARFLLARGCFRWARGLEEDAGEDFRQALKLEPDYRPAEFALRRVDSAAVEKMGLGRAPELPGGMSVRAYWQLHDRYARLCPFDGLATGIEAESP